MSTLVLNDPIFIINPSYDKFTLVIHFNDNQPDTFCRTKSKIISTLVLNDPIFISSPSFDKFTPVIRFNDDQPDTFCRTKMLEVEKEQNHVYIGIE